MAVGVDVFHGRFGRMPVFETDQPVHQHVHPQLHVLIKVGGQDGAYDVERHGACPLTSDRLVLLDPWVPHANWRVAGGQTTTILALYLEASWLRATHGLPGRPRLFPRPSAFVTTEVRQLADELTGMFVQPDAVSSGLVEGLLYQLFRAVLGTYGEGAQLPAVTPFIDSRIRRAITAMRQAAGHGIDLESVRREVSLSRSRFYEQFRACVGISPGLYADGLLLENAIEALMSTDRPLGAIALDLGFAAQGHFSRFFKAKVGFSPSQYRRGASLLV